MKFAALCVIGCAVVSPFSCGTKRAPDAEDSSASTSAANDPERTTTKAKAPKTPADPLVPAIDLGGVPLNRDRLDPAEFAIFDFSSGDRAEPHAHGNKVCASGCAAHNHPTSELSKAKYHWLLRRFAEQPMNETSPALESFMYYGRQSLLWMQREGTGNLDAARIELLRRELKHTHAILRFRVVDEHGVIRVNVPPTRVPLDRRHVFSMDTKDLPPLITSGTVKRVGLHHLWTRL